MRDEILCMGLALSDGLRFFYPLTLHGVDSRTMQGHRAVGCMLLLDGRFNNYRVAGGFKL
jgi:hypothetical protein